MAVCAIATLSVAQLNYNSPVFVPEYIQTQSSYVEALQEPPSTAPVDGTPETSNINIQQLPNADAPKPFYTAEPSTDLKAPSANAAVSDYNTQVYPAVPSDDMQLPSLINWNPNNDPNLYYPVVIDKTAPINVPTAAYPKKYNRNSQKVKPSGFKATESVSDIESISRQKQIDKALHALAKQENRKLLELEKLARVENSENVRKVNDPVPAESGFAAGFSSSHGALSNADFTSHDSISHGVSGGSGDQGGDRMEFHVHGHDGPKSYKWGYDTGKG